MICQWCKLLYALKCRQGHYWPHLSKILSKLWSIYQRSKPLISEEENISTSLRCMYVHKFSKLEIYDSTNIFLREENGKQNYNLQGWKANRYSICYKSLFTSYKTSVIPSFLLLSFFLCSYLAVKAQSLKFTIRILGLLKIKVKSSTSLGNRGPCIA